MNIVFNSSLPRSGSTLLQNVLAQNPSIYCSPTSGVFELLYAARHNFTTLDEFKLQDRSLMATGWRGFCRGGLEGWYSAVTDKPVIVDKFRGAVYYYSWLEQFYPGAKVIVCVRDLRAILASMEKLHRKNSHLHDPADNPERVNFVTVDQRVDHWMNNPPVGLAVRRLQNAVQTGTARKFFFVVYEEFMAEPERVMNALYDYVGVEPFSHDFKNVQQTVFENDGVHGVYGDHTIRSAFTPVKPDWDQVLGKSLCAAIRQKNDWFYRTFGTGDETGT